MIKLPNFFQAQRNRRGDTIVEVLVSIAILSIVLGTAYITSSNSLRTGTDAGSRNEAVGIAQDQVERIKGRVLSGGAVPTFPRFCFDSTGNLVDKPSGADPCEIGNLPYSVIVEYDARRVYTVTVTWESAGGGEPDKMLLHYRAGT